MNVFCAFSQDDTSVVVYPPAEEFDEYTIEEKSGFNEVNTLEVPKIYLKKVPDSVIDKYKKDDAFWYADYEPPKEKEIAAKETASKNNSWLRPLVWFLIIASFIAVIVWFLISSDVQLFRKGSKIITNETAEDPHNNIFEIDYKSEIAKAKKEGNFRLAIRLWYLQVLKNMSNQNIIQYKQEKTNSDYLMNVFGSSYYKDFFKLTRSFEYAWYGQFKVSEEAYEGIENDFKNFNQRLPS